MRIFYALIVDLVRLFLPIIGWFNPKIKSFINQRNATGSSIKNWKQNKSNKPVLWLHCASLGEYEMIVPLISEPSIKQKFEVVVSFFSSSGYNHAKTIGLVDFKFYLPLDRKGATHQLVHEINPSVFVLVKYDFWLNLLTAVNKSNATKILVNGLFGENQFITSPIGAAWRSELKQFDQIYIQNESSLAKPQSLGFNNTVLSKDLRYDRVKQLKNQNHAVPNIDVFTGNKRTLILGSSWPEEEYIALQYLITVKPDLKLIIAPHDVSVTHIEKLQDQYKDFHPVLFTETADFGQAQVLILNTIGHLSSAYQYADFAFIGGAFGKGLHNVLEAAVYGLPMFTGSNIEKFPEAQTLAKLGALVAVDQDPRHFIDVFIDLEQNQQKVEDIKQTLSDFIDSQTGESQKISTYIQSKV